MRKTIFTLLLSIMTFGLLNAQTVIFDPATYDGELMDGMEIVDIDGTNYLRVIVDDWNSTIDIPEVSNIMGTHFSANIGFGQLTPTVEKVMSVQTMDTINLMPNWDGSAQVPSATSLSEDPATDGFKFLKGAIHDNMQLVHQIQFFGQEKTNWGPTKGDTIWCGRIVSVDNSVLLDPAALDPTTLPEGMTVVEEGGEKYLKVEVDEWNTTLPIAPFETDRNNKVSAKVKYEAGSSGVEAASAQTIVNFKAGDSDLFNFAVNPSTTDYSELLADAKPNSTVNTVQFAAQNTEDWSAITGAFVYIGKVTVSYEEAVLKDPPANTATLAFTTEAIEIDGLYDDAYGETAYVIDRVALNETDGDISETNSSGEWLAVGDLENMYIYLEINDDDPIDMPETSSSPWMNDGVEFFLGIKDRRYIGASRIAGEQHQCRINLGTESPITGDVGDLTNQGMPSFFGDSDTTNIEYSIVKGSNGYVIEARIPWATWFRTNSNTNEEAVAMVDTGLFEGKEIAFEVSLIDADEVDGRKSILNWANPTGEDVAYLNNEWYGQVTLSGGWPVGIIDRGQARTELTVYPNPVYNELTVAMDNLDNVQIYNVLGAKVADISVNGNNVINVNNLTKGVYIIKATNNKGKVAVTKFNKN